jgi:hypothetical protein
MARKPVSQEGSALVVPTVEETVAAFRALDRKARAAALAELKDRVIETMTAGEIALATSYTALVAAVTATDLDAPDADLEAAVRLVTLRAIVADLEANVTDRARELAITAEVSDRLRARIEGTMTTRKSASVDGAARSGSDEPKGDIMAHTSAALHAAGGAWLTVADIAKYDSTGFGYTAAYRPSNGAIGRALKSLGAPAIAWRTRDKIEARVRDNGGERPVLMARMGH